MDDNEVEKKNGDMQNMLEKIKDKPEYEEMKSQISEFKKQVSIHGFQQADQY